MSINGFIQIRVMANGRYADCWQEIKNGEVVGYCDDNCRPVALPEPHEAHCLTGQLYFAPGILSPPPDPDASKPMAQPLFADESKPDGTLLREVAVGEYAPVQPAE